MTKDHRKVVHAPKDFVTRRSAGWHRTTVAFLLLDIHQAFRLPADPSGWMAVWMYLDDVVEGRA